MKKRYLILLWLLLVLGGVLVSSWWLSKRPLPAAQTESPKSPDTIKVTIAGEVTKPQIVNLLHGTTLKQALDQVGGITPYAAPNRVKVHQNGQVYTINLKTKNNPALIEGSLIIAPVSQGMEGQSHKNYII